LTNELTEFHFAADDRCWYGEYSQCAENHYPEGKLSTIPPGRESILPLLVKTPDAFVAVAEADLLDWAGMSIKGTLSPNIVVSLKGRWDGKGLVDATTPRVSPWRVLMIGRKPADLESSDLIANLATPNRLTNLSWVKPGACAWDPWWTGTNLFDPEHSGLFARGTTEADKQYIDLAAEMGWPYQLIDWFWYTNMTSYDHSLNSQPNPALADFTRSVPAIDVPELVRYGQSKNVRLFIWAHSLDIKTFGIERSMAWFARLGLAGVKIDFINSQSQEAVAWCQQVLEAAARHHLMIDFHGMYKPTGLARTYPNFITQEGVLGNEYNKLAGNQCTPLHTITLPFTRELLGPMDFTPGGFLNRRPVDFKITVPAEVMGTRARQLAMTVVYFSPWLVLCDSPNNYRNQPGSEFLHDLPTVWDETRVLEADVAKSIVIARRSGDRWYLAAMNGDDAAALPMSLNFLGKGRWTMRSFADQPGCSDYQAVVESKQTVDGSANLNLNLCPSGGFVAVLERVY
jgi:alpha-glucosidase